MTDQRHRIIDAANNCEPNPRQWADVGSHVGNKHLAAAVEALQIAKESGTPVFGGYVVDLERLIAQIQDKNDDQGAELLPADQSAAVTTEPLPNTVAALAARLETVASENGCYGEAGICVTDEPDIRLWCPYCLMGEASKRLRPHADQALDALEFAAAAIIDAIADEDGLDGLAGTHVLKMIDDALVANGRHAHPKPTDENYEQYARECSLSALLHRMTKEVGSGNQPAPEHAASTRRSESAE